MKALKFIWILILVACGPTSLAPSVWIYPGAEFGREGIDSPAHHWTQEDFWGWLHLFGKPSDRDDPSYWTNLFQRIQADPFIEKASAFVEFEAPDMGKDVDMYFDHVFYADGWRKYRGMFEIESTDGGPDYINVYRKGNAYVHLHIFGPWDQTLMPSSIPWTNCWYRMSFIGMKPEELLGRDYAKRASPHR